MTLKGTRPSFLPPTEARGKGRKLISPYRCGVEEEPPNHADSRVPKQLKAAANPVEAEATDPVPFLVAAVIFASLWFHLLPLLPLPKEVTAFFTEGTSQQSSWDLLLPL